MTGTPTRRRRLDAEIPVRFDLVMGVLLWGLAGSLGRYVPALGGLVFLVAIFMICHFLGTAAARVARKIGGR